MWHGIRVRYEFGDDAAFVRGLRVESESVPPELQYRVARLVESDLGMYPREYLRRRVREVVVVSALTIDGRVYGGTYEQASRTAYVTVPTLASGRRGHGLPTAGLHHEIAGLLLAAQDTSAFRDQWECLNPIPFAYAFEDRAWGRLPRREWWARSGDSTLAEGFVSAYGMTNWEDDVETYFEFLMKAPELLRVLGGQHPPIQDKTSLLCDFLVGTGWHPHPCDVAIAGP